ncbi:MAG: ABC transporter ATP-binding protein [Acutalibacteraceae bacterium]|nr:ABC transporter ATP-binding protein [Acutalibacteraceae bacterium]
MNVLEISGLRKRFGSKQALDDVTLRVPENCVFGVVGRNGAGKTTTMKSIVGLLKPDDGKITVCGEPVSYGSGRTNRFIGYLPDVPEFYGYMTAREYMSLCGRVAGMKSSDIKSRTDELLELVGLADEKHRVKGYSRGMKQRLGIAQALISRPKLLICDEPTSALDPVGRREILDILKDAGKQTSVFFSTHILTDVERICDRVAFLEGGRIALSGSIEEIRRMRGNTSVEIQPENPSDTAAIAEQFPDGEITDGCFLLKNASADDAERLMQFLLQHHIAVIRFERKEPDLEDMFMEVIGT